MAYMYKLGDNGKPSYRIVDVTGSQDPVNAFAESVSSGYASGDADWAQGVDNLLTGNVDARRQRQLNDINNAFNASEAGKNRDWQAQQALTAWERSEQSAINAFNRQKELAKNEYSYRIADLRKNGINPYVVLGQSATVPGTPAGSAYSVSGGSASSGSGGSFHSGTAVLSALASVIGSAFRLASSGGDTPHSYTDTYIDKYGEIKGYRTRSY